MLSVPESGAKRGIRVVFPLRARQRQTPPDGVMSPSPFLTVFSVSLRAYSHFLSDWRLRDVSDTSYSCMSLDGVEDHLPKWSHLLANLSLNVLRRCTKTLFFSTKPLPKTQHSGEQGDIFVTILATLLPRFFFFFPSISSASANVRVSKTSTLIWNTNLD